VQIEARRTERTTFAGGDEPAFHTTGSAARGEFHCASCGYGISVRSVLPPCPMCRGAEWEAPATSPFARASL
jgi:rubrerythrin